MHAQSMGRVALLKASTTGTQFFREFKQKHRRNVLE